MKEQTSKSYDQMVGDKKRIPLTIKPTTKVVKKKGCGGCSRNRKTE